MESGKWHIQNTLGPVQKLGELTVKLIELVAKDKLSRGIAQLRCAGFEIPGSILYRKNAGISDGAPKIKEDGNHVVVLVGRKEF